MRIPNPYKNVLYIYYQKISAYDFYYLLTIIYIYIYIYIYIVRRFMINNHLVQVTRLYIKIWSLGAPVLMTVLLGMT